MKHWVILWSYQPMCLVWPPALAGFPLTPGIRRLMPGVKGGWEGGREREGERERERERAREREREREQERAREKGAKQYTPAV